MRTGKHRNKGVYWHEKSYALSTYSRLHCIQFPLFDLSSSNTIFIFIFIIIFFFFFFITFYDNFIGIAIVKTKRCVFLPSALNGFCLLWLLLFTVDFLHTKVIWLMFDRVRNLPLIIVTFSTQISLSKLFFLRIKIKWEIRVMSSHF